MTTVQTALWVVVMLVMLALVFDFMNGFHDAANSIATVVSTGVLKPGQAVVFAAFFNFIAIFVFHLSVAATVGKGIADPSVIDVHVVFGALIAMITIARFRFKMNAVWAFWLSYILTRPLGASFGDWLSQPADNGGLGLGTTQTSLVFLTLIVCSVTCLAYQNKKLIRSK